MKIKRWAVYNGYTKQYYPKRYVLKRSAERKKNSIVYNLLRVLGWQANTQVIKSIKVVELQ